MRKLAYLLCVLLLACSCAKKQQGVKLLPIAESALNDPASIYYQDYAHYGEDLSRLPIGVLDCSIDGYTVMETFLTADNYDNVTALNEGDGIADFGGENFQFLADLANGPYYGYVTGENEEFLKDQILRDVIFLTGKSYYNLATDDSPMGIKPQVKVVMVASPVADYKVIEDVNNFLEATGTGVRALGVMSCGIESMVADVAKQEEICVSVLFPDGGLRARNYEEALKEAAKRKGFAGKLNVFSQEADGLAEAIRGNRKYVDTTASRVRFDYAGPEMGISYNNIDLSLIERYNFSNEANGMLTRKRPDGTVEIQLNSVENYIRYYLVSVIERHRRSGSVIPISKFYLADFRFHYVKHIIEEVIAELYNYRRDGMYLYRNSIASDFRVVDPVQCAVQQCYVMLRENDMLALRGAKSELHSFVTTPSASVSDDDITPDGGLTDSLKYSRLPETSVLTTKQIPLDPRYLRNEDISYIATSLPNTFLLISNSLF